MLKAARIFTLYAKEDESFVEALTAHLSLLRRKGIVKDYYDNEISPTEIWDEQTLLNFAEANIFLFLVSPALLTDEYYKDELIQKVFSPVSQEKINIIPVLIRHCDFSQDPLGQFQMLPANALPVESALWVNQENAWKAVSDGLKELITGEKPEVPITAPGVNPSQGAKRGMSWPLQLFISIVALAGMAGITYFLVNYEPANKEAVAATNAPDSNNISPVAEPLTVPVETPADSVKPTEEKNIPKTNEKPKTATVKRSVPKVPKDTIRKEVKGTVAKTTPPPPPPKAPHYKIGGIRTDAIRFFTREGSGVGFRPLSL